MLDPTSMLRGLAEVGIALTSVSELDDLLELIVSEARKFAGCDGGTVFIRERDHLRLAVWQNETLRRRGGAGGGVVRAAKPLPVDERSMAGYVAATGRSIHIADAYDLPPGSPFGFDRSWDEENQYRTRSVLAVPMNDADGNLVGVLQLINALSPEGDDTPFPDEIEPLVRSLASQAAVAIHNARLHVRLKESYYDTIFRLSVAAEYREPDTANHIKRVSLYAQLIAEKVGMGREDIEVLRFAAPMHDIGKLGVPDAVLLKEGPLNPAEWRIMQAHTLIGHRILSDSSANVLQASAIVAQTHHERWDGDGYPRGLKGEDIPLEGRIVSLADAFDCICSARVYKPPRSFEEAVEIVKQDAGRHFCPHCSEAFLSNLRTVRDIHHQLQESPELEAPRLALTDFLIADPDEGEGA